MAASKRQTTMAKIARERAVLDKRARKAERKEERKRAAAEEQARLENPPADTDAETTDAVDDTEAEPEH